MPANSRVQIGFLPTSLAGCVLWLRADAGVTLAANGSVSGWVDQVGNTISAVQATALQQPVLNVSGSSGLFGTQPVVSATTSAQGLSIPAATVIAVQPDTIFVVGNAANPSGGTFYDGGNARQILQRGTATTIDIYAGSFSANATVDNNPHAFAAIYNGASSFLYMDNSQVPLLANQSIGTANLTGMTLCNNQNFNNNSGITNIAEVIVYQGILTVAQIGMVFDYFRVRYQMRSVG